MKTRISPGSGGPCRARVRRGSDPCVVHREHRATPLRGRAIPGFLLLALAVVGCEPAPEPPAPGTGAPDVPAAPGAPNDDTLLRERTIRVEVYFIRDEEPIAVEREVQGDSPLHGALLELLAGPTPEERAAGLWSWFSAETEGMLRSVDLDPAGRATVDLGDLSAVIPGASSSTGSALLLVSLNRTVFQFPAVAEVEYRMEGSCDAFWNWLQRACDVLPRGSAGIPGAAR